MTTRLRLTEGTCLVAPGAFDPYSARVVESLGFGAVYLGGNALGLQLAVGQPFVTVTETADAVQRVRRVVELPIVVDAGAGFGDAAHAALALRQLARAGASAIHVDDQVYPKRAHYHRGRGRLATIDQIAGKLRWMRDAAGNDGPLLIARTDALRVTGSMEDTITRCKAYRAAGAEALLVLDLSPAQAPAMRAAMPDVPLVWIGGIHDPVPSVDELRSAGFAMALYPFNATAAITEALLHTWSGLANDGRPAALREKPGASLQKALALAGMETHWKIERDTTERDG